MPVVAFLLQRVSIPIVALLLHFSDEFMDPPKSYHSMCRGPGAGAEVTAAGVFSDLIQVAHGLGACV